MKRLKMRSERRGGHVHTTCWIGDDGRTLANIGTLVTDVGEWQTIGAALLLGARAMHGDLVVEFEGDAAVVALESEPRSSAAPGLVTILNCLEHGLCDPDGITEAEFDAACAYLGVPNGSDESDESEDE